MPVIHTFNSACPRTVRQVEDLAAESLLLLQQTVEHNEKSNTSELSMNLMTAKSFGMRPPEEE